MVFLEVHDCLAVAFTDLLKQLSLGHTRASFTMDRYVLHLGAAGRKIRVCEELFVERWEGFELSWLGSISGSVAQSMQARTEAEPLVLRL